MKILLARRCDHGAGGRQARTPRQLTGGGDGHDGSGGQVRREQEGAEVGDVRPPGRRGRADRGGGHLATIRGEVVERFGPHVNARPGRRAVRGHHVRLQQPPACGARTPKFTSHCIHTINRTLYGPSESAYVPVAAAACLAPTSRTARAQKANPLARTILKRRNGLIRRVICEVKKMAPDLRRSRCLKVDVVRGEAVTGQLFRVKIPSRDLSSGELQRSFRYPGSRGIKH